MNAPEENLFSRDDLEVAFAKGEAETIDAGESHDYPLMTPDASKELWNRLHNRVLAANERLRIACETAPTEPAGEEAKP